MTKAVVYGNPDLSAVQQHTARLLSPPQEMPQTDLEAADVERAVELLDEKGWCQQALVRTTGQMCAMGAIMAAVTERTGYEFGKTIINGTRELPDLMELPTYWEAGYKFVAGGFEYMNHTRISVHRWNDAHYTTAQQVKDRLTMAAKKLRDQGK